MTGAAVCEFDVMVDPATLSMAQRKLYSARGGRIRTFANPKVVRGMRIVGFLARNAVRKLGVALPPPGSPVRLEATYHYAVPKSWPRAEAARADGTPCVSHAMGDADNRHKAVQDALAAAGLFPDDVFVSDLRIRKRWTTGLPRIHVRVEADGGDGTLGGADGAEDGADAASAAVDGRGRISGGR